MTNQFDSIDQAIAILKDPNQPELTRNDAIFYLEENDGQEAIDALISVLDDDDYGVRWAAAEALAKMGAKAAPSVLRALLSPDADERLREAVHHIFKNNGDISIRSEAQPLVKALESKSTSIDELTEAGKLLQKLT
jgi:HEAT repeat protein